ncbi:hypothetical protein [Roseateles sp.]|jgi:hypothetical protein
MNKITIQAHPPHVEQLFEPYRFVLSGDFPGYRNHVYRTITYAMHYL